MNFSTTLYSLYIKSPMGCLLPALLLISSFAWQARAYCQKSLEAQKEKQIAMLPPDQLEMGRRTNKSSELTGEVKLKRRSTKWTQEMKQKQSQLMKKYWRQAKAEGRTGMIKEHKERMRQYWKQYKLDKRTDRSVLFKAHSEFMKRYWERLKVEDGRRFEERCKLLGRFIRQYWTPDVREEHGVNMRRY
uniref:Uncharacterized protein n=1 Tax=Cacopsylla melanoneura TaxID=428564 RepID=A0A8D9B257_9HEMI